MKQELKVITLLVFVSFLFCVTMVLHVSAQENDEQRITDIAPMRVEIMTGDAPEPQRRDTMPLSQLDRDIERLRQITQEAENIRNRIAQQQGQQPGESIQPQPQPRRQGRGQLPSATVVMPRAGQGQRRNPAPVSRPGMRAVVDNFPQIVDQLRNAFNNNVERIQNSFQRIQERITNMQAENQRLQNENRELRAENERLRNRIQQLESR